MNKIYFTMRACQKCGKTYKIGGTRKLLRGHYNPTSSGHKKANLQWTRLPAEATAKAGLLRSSKRSLICTRCLKTLTKTSRRAIV